MHEDDRRLPHAGGARAMRASASTIRILKLLVLYNAAILLVWELVAWRGESCVGQRQKGSGDGAGADQLPKPPLYFRRSSSDDAGVERLLRQVEQEVAGLQRTLRLKKQMIEELELPVQTVAAALRAVDRDVADPAALLQEHAAPEQHEHTRRHQDPEGSGPRETPTCDVAARSNNRSEQARVCRKHAAMESMELGAWELVTWSAFDLTAFHERNNGVGRPPAGALRGSRRDEVVAVVDAALRSLPRRFERRHLVEGIRRTYRRHGTQYELFFREPSDDPGNDPGNELGNDGGQPDDDVVHRVRVVRPLGKLVRSARRRGGVGEEPLRVVDTAARRLHLVVAVPTSNGLRRLRDFLDGLVANVTSREPSPSPELRVDGGDGLRLTLVAMDADPRVADEAARRLGDAGFHGYRVVHASPGAGADPFAALRLAMDDTEAAERRGDRGRDRDVMEVVVGLDLDHLPSVFTLCRCRAVVEAGRQAYWPVAFHLYNPLMMTYMSNPLLRSVSGRRGFWDEDDFATFCMARSDLLDALGQFPVGRGRGHGASQLEPGLALYRQLVQSRNVSVIRAPDRGLLCPHRPSKCELKPVQEPVAAQKAELAYDKCRERKARSEGPPYVISELIFGSQKARDRLFAEDALVMKTLD